MATVVKFRTVAYEVESGKYAAENENYRIDLTKNIDYELN